MSSLEHPTPEDGADKRVADALNLTKQGVSQYDLMGARDFIQGEKNADYLDRKIEAADKEEAKGFESISKLLDDTTRELRYNTSISLDQYKRMIENIEVELSSKTGASGPRGAVMTSADTGLKDLVYRAQTLNVDIARRGKDLLIKSDISKEEHQYYLGFFDKYKERPLG